MCFGVVESEESASTSSPAEAANDRQPAAVAVVMLRLHRMLARALHFMSRTTQPMGAVLRTPSMRRNLLAPCLNNASNAAVTGVTAGVEPADVLSAGERARVKKKN